MASKSEVNARLRREQDILERVDNVRRLIQMEFTLEISEGCGLYSDYKPYVRHDNTAFGDRLIDDLRDEIQRQLLSITALCYGDNPDIGEPMPMLEWKINSASKKNPKDIFRDVWDECLEWNA